MKRRKLICLIVTFCMAAVMAGCGEEPVTESTAEAVTLLEPAGLVGNGEAAACRNLYNATVYSATVVPWVEEYGFTEGL